MSELEKHVKNIKIAKFEAPDIKRLEFSKNLEDSIEKVVREQDFFHRCPLNFPKIQTDVYTYSFIPGASNLSILLFSMCPFHL